MRILIIDDGRVLPDLKGHDVTYARRLSSARRELFDNGPWDEVYLDHDLGFIFDEELGEPVEETIRPIVREIEERWNAADPPGEPPEVVQYVIITDNPGGRAWIQSTLVGAGCSWRQDRPRSTFDWDAKKNEEA